MFDSHCHLNLSPLESDIDSVISEAAAVGVTNFLIPGVTIESSKKALEIAKKISNCYAAVGIHPTEKEFDLAQLDSLISNEATSAVGEIGLDYHRDGYDGIKQKELFEAQIELAIKYTKPIIIHSRDAAHDTINILNKFLPRITKRMVFHCCEPDERILSFAMKNNIFMGVDGDVTYNTKKAEFVKAIPLELLLLETDSPYLTPEPIRSSGEKVNSPKNMKASALYIASLLKIDISKLDEITTANTWKLLGSV